MAPRALVLLGALLGVAAGGCRKEPPAAQERQPNEPRTDLVRGALATLFLGLPADRRTEQDWNDWGQNPADRADPSRSRQATPLSAGSVAAPVFGAQVSTGSEEDNTSEPSPDPAARPSTLSGLGAEGGPVPNLPPAFSGAPASGVAPAGSRANAISSAPSDAPAPALPEDLSELAGNTRSSPAERTGNPGLARSDESGPNGAVEPSPASEEEVAVRRAISAAVSALLGAGKWYTDANAGPSTPKREETDYVGGYTGIGAGTGYTGIGAGPGHTGIGAGPGHTGVGAGPGHTGIGAGPGHTGIGAGPVGTAAPANITQPLGVLVMTPAGPVLMPVVQTATEQSSTPR
jgi:hypothetical protein